MKQLIQNFKTGDLYVDEVPGKNGYIIRDRDPLIFAEMIKKALQLKNVREYSMEVRDRFSVDNLKSDLENIWLSKV